MQPHVWSHTCTAPSDYTAEAEAFDLLAEPEWWPEAACRKLDDEHLFLRGRWRVSWVEDDDECHIWTDDDGAVCRLLAEHDGAVYTASETIFFDRHGSRRAVEVCRTCDYQAECLLSVIHLEAPSTCYGVFGGLLASQRETLITMLAGMGLLKDQHQPPHGNHIRGNSCQDGKPIKGKPQPCGLCAVALREYKLDQDAMNRSTYIKDEGDRQHHGWSDDMIPWKGEAE